MIPPLNIPRSRVNIFADKDKDGYPAPIDCNDSNPKKQGIKEFVGFIGKNIQRYRENAPEREKRKRERELTNLQHTANVMEQKKNISASRMEMTEGMLEVEKKRAELSKTRAETQRIRMANQPKMPSSFGGVSDFPVSPFADPFSFRPKKVKEENKEGHKRHRHKAKNTKPYKIMRFI